jgi:transposase
VSTAPFPPGRGGGDLVEYGYKGKGVTIHSLVDANGNPLAITATPANASERAMVEPLLDCLDQTPQSLYADKGYDATWLRWHLAACRGIVPMIARRSWPKPATPPPITQNHRWVVERTFSWYQRKFRRLNIKWERQAAPWLGFLSLALSFFWISKLVG